MNSISKNSSARKLSIFYQNTRGLRTKCFQLKQNILCNDFDVIIITETWLHAGIYDGELCDDRYDVFRNDRNLLACGKSSGGGVMILTKKYLCATRYEVDPGPPTEMLTIIFPSRVLSASSDLYISTVYVPPSQADTRRQPIDIELISSTLKNILAVSPDVHYMLIGDFNLPYVQWDENGPLFLKRGSIEIQNAAINLVQDLNFLGLSQFNKFKNHAGNVLDLVFCNLPVKLSLSSSPLIVKEDTAHTSLILELEDLNVIPLKNASVKKIILGRLTIVVSMLFLIVLIGWSCCPSVLWMKLLILSIRK